MLAADRLMRMLIKAKKVVSDGKSDRTKLATRRSSQRRTTTHDVAVVAFER